LECIAPAERANRDEIGRSIFSSGIPLMQKPTMERRSGKESNKGAHYFMHNHFYANLTRNTEVPRIK
jgi:hypothetical protein